MLARLALSAVAIVALATALGSNPATAACSDRPATPDRMQVNPVANASHLLRLEWRNSSRGGERLFWDIEVKDQTGKVVQSDAGRTIGSGRIFEVPARHFWFSINIQGLRPSIRYCVRVRARTEKGTEGCVSKLWAGPVCATTVADASPGKPDSAKEKFCRTYADRAVGTVRYAREMGCDATALAGRPRWSPNVDDHVRWCMGWDTKAVNAEERRRTQLAHECRVKAGMPQTGTTTLSVTSKGGDTFTLSVAGFAPNVPVIIDVSGPGAQPGSITVDMKGNRIVAGANGAVTVTLFGAKVCKRGGGLINFTARDQDGRKSNKATATCAP